MLCLSHIIMTIKRQIEPKHEYFVTQDEFKRYCEDVRVETIEILASPMRDIVEDPEILEHPKVKFLIAIKEPEIAIAES